MRIALLTISVLAVAVSGCDCGGGQLVTGNGGGSHGNGGASGNGGGSGSTGGSASTGGSSGSGGSSGTGGGAFDAGPNSCSALNGDLAGCPCNGANPRMCYSNQFPPTTRNVGECHDGTQTCVGNELPVYGACSGEQDPVQEVCNDNLDNDCNGKTDCDDSSCAMASNCMAACQPGQTRPCYTGPAGTQHVGLCHDGAQTCLAGGVWSTSCDGQQLPTSEACCDSLDHNCNGVGGCLDLFSCFTASCCTQTQCNADAGAGCTCPQGQGDTATCPRGTFGVSGGGLPGWAACCPCSGSTCNNAACCAEAACQGNSQCSGLTCRSQLPASCMGQVNWDCDDFPEDCDEPCCPCSSCSCVLTGDACGSDSDCCSGNCGGTTCN
jgi:hypothetical protein